ncbi:MAG: efflux RND transporter periplasmic adaptor subunit [Planctomycetales bacterium]|nr:efflux RND transporter periplasmic adaptor subunit [Planctomycetales bacterium]
MSRPDMNRSWLAPIFAVVCLVAVVATAAATRDQWLPLLRRADESSSAKDHADHDAEDDHAHEHDAHAAASIKLSQRGLKNIGFEPLTVEPGAYDRQLTLPAIVVERPGRSQVHITAPLTGVVTRIGKVTGEAVAPGETLFELQLTHEELVAAQREFLETSSTLEVVQRELARLQSLGEGVVSGRRILEQQYEQQKLEVALSAAQQAMLLHGLSEEQIEQVRQTHRLLRNITIRAPEHGDTDECCTGFHLFTVQRLGIARGEHVAIGDELAVLADHCELYIEAQAFEDDAAEIRCACANERQVTAQPMQDSTAATRIEGLEVLYVAGQIDPESRAFKVYVRLPNEIALDKQTPDGKRFLEWAYKPGQRMRISVPVETWENQLALPKTAIVDEGAEAYVYRQNGERFEQVPVHVLHRDQNAVVIANDGALFKGDVIAGQGAYQMHLALKNAAGGGIDPHAGHNH